MSARYSLGLYEKSMPAALTWAEKLDTAKRCGFDFIEISVDETDEKLARLDWSSEERLELLRLTAEKGIRLETMCLSGHRRYPIGSAAPAVRERGMEIMEKAILLARDLGIRIIQIAGYDVYYEESTAETKRLFGENLKKSVEQAARSGVLLAFETMETPFLNTVEKAMRWVREIDSPFLMVYPDSGNITNAAAAEGKNVLDDIETGRGCIAAFHLKETVPGKFREIPYGTGHVNFAAVTSRAWALGVRRYMAEFWYTGQTAWEQDIRYANDFLRSWLDVL